MDAEKILFDPRTLEFATTLYLGAKVPLGEGKGFAPKEVSSVVKTEEVAAKKSTTGFNALVKQLPKAGQQNVRILQNWAKSKGFVKSPNTGGPQTWGV